MTMTTQRTLPLGQKRPGPSTTAAFNLPSSNSSDTTNDNLSQSNDDEDGAPLPFPTALPRSDFLSPEFHPAAYLSALPERHQTLEDLRSDLRDRSAAISSELLELVNSNYTAFLSLGDELRGGDEKVEDVKVALLGFKRAVGDVKGKVGEKKREAEKMGGELGAVRKSIEDGRQMLEVSERLAVLEERLAPEGVVGADHDDLDYDTDDSDEDDEEEEGKAAGLQGSSPAKLEVSARQCVQIVAMMETLDEDHLFVLKLEERLARCRNTLLLDLGNAVAEAKKSGAKGHERLFRYLGIYRVIDAQDAAVKALKNR